MKKMVLILSLLAIVSPNPLLFAGKKERQARRAARKEKRKERKEKRETKGFDTWKLPNRQLRYDQVCYLTSHNSFASTEEGFIYAQQVWSMKKQLDNGVRSFMLDFWLDAKDSVAKLCHSKCKTSKWLKAGRKHRTVLSALQMIKNWLDEHPNEIITLDLENYISSGRTYNLFKDADLINLLLTKNDWDPDYNNGLWPTLGWMIKKNKRLVVFDTQGTSGESMYAYSIQHYMIRNMYGTLNIDKAAKVRGSVPSPKPNLYQLNYMGTVTSLFAYPNKSERLKKVFEAVQKKGYLRPGQMPNFIAIDNVHLGNAMEWVNELNSEARVGQ